MIDGRGLTHSYQRGSQSICGVNLNLRSGITGLVGVNGAGKSTLLNVLSGGLRPTSGTLRVDQLSMYAGRRREREQALAKVALMPQTGSFPKALTCMDFVSYLTWMRGVPRIQARDRAGEALGLVKLDRRRNSRMGSLSGGMVRRVWLAQALAAPGDNLLLDEPSTGLDPRQRAIMVDVLHSISKKTVLLSSHILEDVNDLAHRVIVLDAGKVVHDGPVESTMDSDWFTSVTTSAED